MTRMYAHHIETFQVPPITLLLPSEVIQLQIPYAAPLCATSEPNGTYCIEIFVCIQVETRISWGYTIR